MEAENDMLDGDWLDMINEEAPAPQVDYLLVNSTSIAPAGFTRQHSLELSPPAKRKKSSGGFESPSMQVPLAITQISTSSAAKRQQASSANTKTDMSPEEMAEVVAVKATEELRANGLAFMEQESSTLHTLEEFRKAFNGANGPTFDSDDEQVDEVDDKKRKRVRPNNPDADLIERATEEQVQILKIDCRGTEGKKQRRRIRNRMSAQLHRERKKLYIDALEAFVKIKEGRIGALERDVMALAKENERLRGAQGMPTMSMSAVCSESTANASTSGNGNNAQGHGDNKSVHIATGGSTDGDSGSELTNSPLHEGEAEVDTTAIAINGMSDDDKSLLSELLHTEEETQQTQQQQQRATRNNGRGGGETGIRVSGAMAPLFPLLSVICLLCVTMYNGVPAGLTTPIVSTTGESGAPPHRRLTASPSTSTGAEDLDATSLAVVSVVSTSNSSPEEEQAHLNKQWQTVPKREKGVERHEADLLALPAPSTASDTTGTTSLAPDLYSLLHGHYPDGPYGHVSNSLEKGLILWKRDRLLSHIYPRYNDEVTGMQGAAGAGTGEDLDLDLTDATLDRNVTIARRRANEVNRKAGNLRGRPISATVTRQTTTTTTTTAAEPSAANALIPSATMPGEHTKSSGTPPSSPRSVSRVLLNRGLVLLDPKLAVPIAASAASANKSSSSSDARSDSSVNLPTAVGIHSGAHPHTHPSTEGGAPSAPSGIVEENVVMIAVPASSVRWGNSWANSVPNQYYNATASERDGEEGFNEEVYIELLCSVNKVQAVSALQTHENHQAQSGQYSR